MPHAHSVYRPPPAVPVPANSPETFKVAICRRFGVPVERYGETVLRRTLYLHAGWLRSLPAGPWLAPDRDLIEEVGWQTQWRGFHSAARDYRNDARNRRFGRRTLRLRVSVSRLRDLFADTFGGNPPSTPPFAPAGPAYDGPAGTPAR